jgi:hypothetical protein
MAITLNGTTGISGVNGSAGTPALQGADANTGIFFGTDEVSIATGGSNRLIVDSSGRVGLGTSSVDRRFVVSDSTDNNLPTTVLTKTVTGGGNSGLHVHTAGTDAGGGAYGFRVTSGSTYGSPTNELFRVDVQGRVGIGSNSPDVNLVVEAATGDATIRVHAAENNSGSEPTLILESSNDFAESIIEFKDSSGTGGGIRYNHGDNALRFQTNGTTERARIDSSGRLLVGTSTALGPSTTSTGITLYPNDYSVFSSAGNEPITVNRNNDGAIVSCRRSGVSVGSISVTTTATAFNTSSDYRLKENVVPLIGAVDRLNQLQVHRFNFIADPDKTVDGFIAHEAQAVVPECVTGTKDAVDADGNPVYQGIDQSKLVPLLTAALQEAMERIETLEAKVAALEGA